jgi:hypothetical protein
MLKNYNWANLKPGEGVFVPGLDVHKLREMGLRAAILPGIRFHERVHAKIGIRNGLIGVLFYRRHP